MYWIKDCWKFLISDFSRKIFHMETFSQKNNNFFSSLSLSPLWQHHSANVYSENRQLGVCGAFLHRDDTQVDSFRPVAILHKCLDLPWFYHRLCKSFHMHGAYKISRILLIRIHSTLTFSYHVEKFIKGAHWFIKDDQCQLIFLELNF